MRAAVEAFARRWWAGELGWSGSALSVLAAPMSWAWSGATWVRDRRFGRHGGARIEGLSVVSVGNLAVGGTGKTPCAAWVAEVLRAAGAPTSLLVSDHGEDEALLHRGWNPDVPVIADRDRVAGALRARADGARVVVLDDGFQHRRLARDLDLVLLAVEDRFPGPVLPRGPYREAPHALSRTDAVLVTRRSATAEEARALAAVVEQRFPGVVKGGVHLAPGAWVGLDGRIGSPPVGDVLAVCAVARPRDFRSTVEARVGGMVELVAFADHHEYSRADAQRLRERAGARPIVVTEKDAVKLHAYRHVVGEAYVLTQKLRWDWGEENVYALLATLTSGVTGR